VSGSKLATVGFDGWAGIHDGPRMSMGPDAESVATISRRKDMSPLFTYATQQIKLMIYLLTYLITYLFTDQANERGVVRLPFHSAHRLPPPALPHFRPAGHVSCMKTSKRRRRPRKGATQKRSRALIFNHRPPARPARWAAGPQIMDDWALGATIDPPTRQVRIAVVWRCANSKMFHDSTPPL